MRKTFTLLAIAAFAANVSSQVISQNADQTTITALNSVACGAQGVYTADNSYTRAFNLADYAITYDYKITNVKFGVETVNKDLSVNVNLHSLAGTFPGGALTLLASVPVAVTSANALGLVDTGTNLTQVIPAGSKIVLEIFYMGTNASAQTGPSYIKSVKCGITNPTATGTGPLASFANSKWVMTITGVNNLGVTEIINSKDLQVYPNPVKDVFNFKMASNLQVETVELYDMTGRKVNTVNAKNVKDINVSNLRKGTYILKVEANDGKVYVQKVLKD